MGRRQGRWQGLWQRAEAEHRPPCTPNTARHQGARFISGQVAGGVEPRERGRVVAKHDVFASWMVAPSRGMYIAVPGGILG